MSALFLYLLKVTLINALMLGFYHFSIRSGRNFQLMRAVLLLAIVLPLLLPIVPQSLIYIENTQVPVYVFTLPETADAVTIAPRENQNLIPILQNTIYLTFASLLLLGTILSILSVVRKYIRAREKSTLFGKVLLDEKAKSPYSFFSWVFFSEEGLLHPAANWLLKHEFSHVKHGHSFDRLLSSVFRSFFWFSPFAHLNHRLLAEVHEYQADADAIQAFGDKTVYSNLIVSFSGIPGHNSMTNPFSAHLKKRMIMLNNFKPGKLSLVRLLSGIIIIMAVALLSSMIQPEKTSNLSGNVEKEIFADNVTPLSEMIISKVSPVEQTHDIPEMQNDPAKKKISNTNEVFTVVENPPQYPGGEDARVAYMQKAITYPELAKKNKTEGTVYVTFVIEKDGQVSNAKILRGIGNGCDEVALKAIQQMPPWRPGTQKGEAVRVQFNMPVSFKLGAKEKEVAYSEPITDVTQDVFTVVEDPPQFPGGIEAQQT
ncbi:MAG: M56 family metallopeptidase, partial [Lentimicrobium sp.]|nr:M56 family metallopeptidase [Lentimicrobium sp.]